jgi:predicted methyltransferase
MIRAIAFAAFAFALVGSGTAVAKTPAYIAAAIANPNRSPQNVARDALRKPAAMLEFAGVKPGDVVVDLIPGGGYFTQLFAGAVGPKGWVYSFEPTEFDAEAAKFHEKIPTGAVPGYPNATFIHASIEKLPIPQRADVIWTSQNYHDLHDPFTGPVDIARFNKAVYAALKPGGTYIVLDHAAQAGSGLRDTNTLHRIDPAVVKKEVLAAGFKFVGESNVLRNPKDDHTKRVFDKSIRGHTDQFIFKFRKPLK